MQDLLKLIAGIGIAAMGILGLAITFCGGFFTVTSLLSYGDGYAGMVLIVSVPSIALGALMVWGTYRILMKRSNSESTKHSTPPQDPPDPNAE
ncbi:MAG: hypothetical protein HY255_01170 [Betaproteobacteria bacterium]|nr:hypothetical protein [Betaproteobacteria bacterium]